MLRVDLPCMSARELLSSGCIVNNEHMGDAVQRSRQVHCLFTLTHDSSALCQQDEQHLQRNNRSSMGATAVV